MLVCRIPDDGMLADQVESDPVTRLVHGAAPALYSLVTGGDNEKLERLWKRAKESIGDLPDVSETVRDEVSDRLGGGE